MNVYSNNLRGGEQSSVVVGSGFLYAVEYDRVANPYAITDEEMALFEEIGYIESNAVLKATAAVEALRTANYGRIGNIYADKAVSFVTGVISWNMEHVAKYLTGSTYEETDTQTRFYYGVDDRSPKVCLLFIAEDDYEGQRITIVMPNAQFQGELEMDFNAESPVSFNYGFDLNGTVNPADHKSYYFYTIEEKITADSGTGGDTTGDDTTGG